MQDDLRPSRGAQAACSGLSERSVREPVEGGVGIGFLQDHTAPHAANSETEVCALAWAYLDAARGAGARFGADVVLAGGDMEREIHALPERAGVPLVEVDLGGTARERGLRSVDVDDSAARADELGPEALVRLR